MNEQVRIFNGTPHEINVITNATYKTEIRKYVTDNPEISLTIPSDGVLSAKITTEPVDKFSNGLPIYEKRITGVDTLPDNYDIYIVSALYASAYKNSDIAGYDKLYTVADPVYSSDGKTILGCLGICKAF